MDAKLGPASKPLRRIPRPRRLSAPARAASAGMATLGGEGGRRPTGRDAGRQRKATTRGVKARGEPRRAAGLLQTATLGYANHFRAT